MSVQSLQLVHLHPNGLVKELKKAIPVIHSHIGWSAYDRVLLLELQDHPECFLIAKKEKDILGYINFSPLGYKEYYVSFIAVDSPRNGVGTLLMLELIKKVQNLGIEKLVLDFKSSKPGLKEFYASIGRKAGIEASMSSENYGKDEVTIQVTYSIGIAALSISLSPSPIQVVPYDAATKNVQNAIQQIHKTVNWVHYDETVLSSLRIAPETFIIAKDKDNILGYVNYNSMGDRVYYISYIAVNRQLANRSGVGTQLMMKTIAKVKNKGAEWLCLDYRGNISSLTEFYKSIGKKAGIETVMTPTGIHYRNGDPKVDVTYFLNKKT